MKTIGIDPGLASTGIGIVRGTELKVEAYSYGSITTSKNIPLPSRLNKIFSKLFIILKDEKPDLMVVEDIFSLQKYPKSGITLGKVTGVILLAGNKLDLPVIEVQVREAKQILTGNGNASKMQLERAVRHFLNLTTPIRPYHASDAIGLALIGLFRYQDGLKTQTMKSHKTNK
ncbi:MAG: crossover junction endodeoxyribonuclease RuvC [Desulfobacterales bacterium]|uniref:Crossover junction endodeoxyribonuclease RuvC n=1 Tax=Candidatus Desulfaltia bathyphila TaxID=2841697 RepID=A0A8J6TBK5_9BACT|nr:crossover junction endodeoxyribonuclease RuvC [Candidatus Desulfaltia bathyphila]MBL7196009.1 crossover junction endodeoxyribonuclease RuvC [Desulfobacterales bacterium]MBL7207431.1 crossover junction endodeoxyribonuclease RuvC [Desulfobacterales bacterium]